MQLNLTGPKSSVKHSVPFRAHPMLATLAREPFDRKGWVYEEKYDGYRILAYKEGRNVEMFSRNAINRAARYPAIADAIRGLRQETLVLDGEVAVFDRTNISRFQLLQRAATNSVFVVFDCLFVDGRDLRRESLSTRRAELEKLLSSRSAGPTLMLSKRLAANGLAAFKIAAREGFEGMIAKYLSSPYVEGRSSHWLKVKVHQEEELVIGGFTKPEGTRKFFGALLLGAYVAGKLYYVGKVGTGFDEETLASLHKKLQPLVKAASSFVDLPRERNVSFVAPMLVAQISFSEITADAKVRQAVFLGLRDDKSPKEVRLPRTS
jgi:bifunctional non-homologous end joining protein LigD